MLAHGDPRRAAEPGHQRTRSAIRVYA